MLQFNGLFNNGFYNVYWCRMCSSAIRKKEFNLCRPPWHIQNCKFDYALSDSHFIVPSRENGPDLKLETQFHRFQSSCSIINLKGRKSQIKSILNMTSTCLLVNILQHFHSGTNSYLVLCRMFQLVRKWSFPKAWVWFASLTRLILLLGTRRGIWSRMAGKIAPSSRVIRLQPTERSKKSLQVNNKQAPFSNS